MNNKLMITTTSNKDTKINFMSQNQIVLHKNSKKTFTSDCVG